IKLDVSRKDIAVYPMAVKELVRNDPGIPVDFRDLVGNMIYVGVLAEILGIERETIRAALEFHFKGRQKPVDMNFHAVEAGAAWAAANLNKQDPYFVERMAGTDGLIMADGNTAAAIGAIFGGIQFAAWYPITPASSLAEALNDYLPEFRTREDGKHTYAVMQAEDELAAIGMAIGAGWSGLRAMTSTSGPGLSLMTEFAGLAYYSEIPLVVWDVQRIGPSTGLPTRTSQGDLTFVNFIGHGDTQQVVLLPGNVEECFEFGWRAFDIAEQLQWPVFVLSDLDMGMNQWMSKPFMYPDQPMERGKILWEEDLEKLKANWGRYLDKDGDGVPYRTVPGNRHPAGAYFTRGTGHDEHARYTEDPQVWHGMMERLKRKYETARNYVPGPVVRHQRGAQAGIIGFGSTEAAILEAQDQLSKEDGLPTDFLRLRSLPFTDEVQDFISRHETIYVVEMNRDGQLAQLLKIAYPDCATEFRSVAFQDGLPAAARWIRDGILGRLHAEAGRTKTKTGRSTESSPPRRSSGARRAAGKPRPRKTVASGKK
ncbi:MAG: 2-oxoacid:acceptor oxidoreductase family protein, partial [Anaerolineales bacterium]